MESLTTVSDTTSTFRRLSSQPVPHSRSASFASDKEGPVTTKDEVAPEELPPDPLPGDPFPGEPAPPLEPSPTS